MNTELPEQVISLLGIEKLTRITIGNANSAGLLPVMIDIATLDYEASSQKSDHYLLRDAPYSVARGNCKSAYLTKAPSDATHYSLGPMREIEYVAADRNRSAVFTSYLPILFWKGST